MMSGLKPLSSFLLGALLLSGGLAARIDIAKNRGFHPNLKNSLAKRGPAVTARAAPEDYQYYNEGSKPYFVESLPDIPQEFMTEMYSGLMPIDEDNPDRALFFVFQPRIGGPPVDEITVWTNGGPGCSSLEGFFQENGWIQWTWGQYAPQTQPYSWVNLTNMLWVEQPVGTGFSIGKVTATTQEEIADDFVGFYKNFQKTFGIQNHKTYVTGESYAGRYVPYIANAMLDQNDTCYFDLGGILVYDPCIGAYDPQDDMYMLDFAVQNNNILGYNQSFLDHLAELDQECGFAEFKEQYMQYPPSGVQPPLEANEGKCGSWNLAYEAAYAVNPCFNVYFPVYPCPLQSDPLGYPTDLQYSYPGLPIYFDRSDVKEAMHAPNISWLECAPHDVFKKGIDSSLDPIQYVLPKVIEATGRVLVANAALDMDILTNSTLLAIQNMTWNGDLGFQVARETWADIDITLPDLQFAPIFESSGFPPIDGPQGIMGKQHYERGLMFAETYLAGHMEPQFQPRSAYRHLQWVLGRIDEL